MALEQLSQPIRLGHLTLKNRIFLAPLAGVSDVPMRRLCQQFGAGLTYVEMLSATAILYKNRKTFEMMARHPGEGVLGVQVTGPSAQEVAQAIEILDAKGFDTIDINMGCPVKKVVQAGCGSGILRDKEKTAAVLSAARQATARPLSVKTRLGFTREELTAPYVCSLAAHLGYEMVTLHGRTRSESYNTPVDAHTMGLAFGAIPPGTLHGSKTPLTVGNGDVFGVEGACHLVEVGGADAIMVSRGALGNPWIFQSLLSGQEYLPTITEWCDVVLQHLSWHGEHYGPRPGAAVLFRKHLIWYAKGFPGAKALRERAGELDSLTAMAEAVRAFGAQCDPGLRRSIGVRDAPGPAPTVNAPAARPDHPQAFDPKWDMHRELDRGVGDACLPSSPSPVPAQLNG